MSCMVFLKDFPLFQSRRPQCFIYIRAPAGAGGWTLTGSCCECHFNSMLLTRVTTCLWHTLGKWGEKKNHWHELRRLLPPEFIHPQLEFKTAQTNILLCQYLQVSNSCRKPSLVNDNQCVTIQRGGEASPGVRGWVKSPHPLSYSVKTTGMQGSVFKMKWQLHRVIWLRVG